MLLRGGEESRLFFDWLALCTPRLCGTQHTGLKLIVHFLIQFFEVKITGMSQCARLKGRKVLIPFSIYMT